MLQRRGPGCTWCTRSNSTIGVIQVEHLRSTSVRRRSDPKSASRSTRPAVGSPTRWPPGTARDCALTSRSGSDRTRLVTPLKPPRRASDDALSAAVGLYTAVPVGGCSRIGPTLTQPMSGVAQLSAGGRGAALDRGERTHSRWDIALTTCPASTLRRDRGSNRSRSSRRRQRPGQQLRPASGEPVGRPGTSWFRRASPGMKWPPGVPARVRPPAQRTFPRVSVNGMPR